MHPYNPTPQEMDPDNPTPQEIARHYSAMLDSVVLINRLVPATTQDDLDAIDRNTRHLELMVSRDWWEGYDLTPILAAISAGNNQEPS